MKKLNKKKILKECRNCKSKLLTKLFSLGNLASSGKFAKNKKTHIQRGNIILMMCKKCSLVQLKESYNKNYLFNKGYGYRTGINIMMINHMKKLKKDIEEKIELKKNDAILDIASNDATFLNQFNKNLFKVGIDPLIIHFKKYYKFIDKPISNFFSYENVFEKTKKKFKLITAFSVFYDLEDPNSFLNDVKNLLTDDGIFLLEQADLLSIIKLNMFDTLCHEHVAYYSTKIISEMANHNGLQIFDLKKNKTNGGSIQYFICKKNAKIKINKNKLKNFLKEEKKFKIGKVDCYKNFFLRVNMLKLELLKILKNIKNSKKIIHGYGASTKGNILLQYYKINNKTVNFIAERNKNKFNCFTPGSKIKIISEDDSRKQIPDYYLVLPWHFKDSILIRERKIINQGTKFIFPLPNVKII